MKLTKTESGQLAFKERSPLFSARQRAAFILFDGKKTVAAILDATAILGLTQADVDYLMEQGFLVLVQEPVAPESTKPLVRVHVPPQDHGTTHVDRWTMF